MSNYKRLISYIYAYEGEKKGNNIGFAKIDVRGDQCRIQVNGKRIFVGNNDMGVYLLSVGKEIPLGRMFVRGGVGEFRMQVNASNVEGSGISIHECYGLTIHDVGSNWQNYTTIWEDAVAQAAEIELAEMTTAQLAEKQLEERRLVEKQLVENEQTQVEQVQAEGVQARVAEQELSEITEQEMTQEPDGDEEKMGKTGADHIEEGSRFEGQAEVLSGEEKSVSAVEHKSKENEVKNKETEVLDMPELVISREIEAELEAEEQKLEAVAPWEESEEPEDLNKLQELDRKEQEEESHQNIWEQLQGRYAKILAFEYEKGCEILSIKPQDIGLLPREIWVYGNNSFLLHGYYNYRHLILAKLYNSKGMPRYLLGVPGHYFSNEKCMASMFGFPHFVLAKQQPEEDGRFGYWYTDIRL